MLKRFLHTSAPLLNVVKLNEVPLNRIRNIGIIAHIDAGKTTTTERMLFYSGKTARIGNVDEGDTVTDYLPSERERGITIQSAAITIPWNGKKINIIDTPGHADFTFEVIRSLRVLDGAVTILDAVAGVEAQTEKVWKQAHALSIPKIAYINKMDRPGAGFSRTVKEIILKLQTRVVLCTLPYFTGGDDPQFDGVIDIIHKKLLIWDRTDVNGRAIKVVDLNEPGEDYSDAYDLCIQSRESMVETLGEIDESVIESFFEVEDYMKVPEDILQAAIRSGCLANELTPVLCGSSFKNIGVQPLMDAVTTYLPSPLDTAIPEISTTSLVRSKKKKSVSSAVDVPVAMTPKGLVVNNQPNLALALAFKVMTHATKGVMTFFRVYSGKLVSNSVVVNSRTGEKLHLKKLMIMHGDEPEEVKSISAGNIGVVIGHEEGIVTGDTLVAIANKKVFSDSEANLKLMPIEIPPPLFNSGIEPNTAGDERYMNECLRQLVREDPSLKVSVDEDLGQTVVSGMGELHLEIINERLVKDMKAKVRFSDVVVSYRETLTKASPELTLVHESGAMVTLALDSFEGNASDSDAAEEPGALVFESENNVIIFDPETATSPHLTEVKDQRRWKSEAAMEELQDSLIRGCLTAMQLGGPVYGMALHSMVIRVLSFDFPAEDSSVSPSVLSNVSRELISNFVKSSSAFAILEPVMETKVFVGADHLGEVSHDLVQRCQAVINSISDEDDNSIDSVNWAREQADRVFLPPDYTMSLASGANLTNRKIIHAQTPLKEMVGYLSKLRSMTGGRGTFDMSYVGMRRATKQRSDQIGASI